jgi:hypothetical protein
MLRPLWCSLDFARRSPLQGPIEAVARKAKCRQINGFQGFIPSFPSFGRGFDSHRPLQLNKDKHLTELYRLNFETGTGVDSPIMRLSLSRIISLEALDQLIRCCNHYRIDKNG